MDEREHVKPGTCAASSIVSPYPKQVKLVTIVQGNREP